MPKGFLISQNAAIAQFVPRHGAEIAGGEEDTVTPLPSHLPATPALRPLTRAAA